MEQLFLPYDLSLIAKQKGFNEFCFAYYDGNKKLLSTGSISHLNVLSNTKNSNIGNAGEEYKNCITAPLHQQITDWLREEHKIHISMVFENLNKGYYGALVTDKAGKASFNIFGVTRPINYYETLNKAIEEIFKLI